MRENKYKSMTYRELMRAAGVTKPGKEARLIHKELRKYGDGLLFWDRYPLLIQILVILFDVAVSVSCVLATLNLFGFI